MTDNEIIELIAVADAREQDILTTIGNIGPKRVAEILANEITFRFQPPRTLPDAATKVQFALSCQGDEISFTITVTPRETTFTLGAVKNPTARVDQELTEILRLVYGSNDSTRPSTRRLQLHDAQAIETFIQPPDAYAVVQRLLAAIDERSVISVAELASRYGSDKWGIHLYAQHYQRHFEPLRNRLLTILEIGIGGFGTNGYADPTKGGGSLRMWKHFFPRALVHGADIENKSQLTEQRIEITQVDQSDRTALREMAEAFGPFDIVIDDGSHINSDVLASFDALFPYLTSGGLYVIEDLQTSYWPYFGGDSQNLNDVTTSIGFLKTLVDGLNHEELMTDTSREPRDIDRLIQGLHFYHNIVFIEKGINVEGGGPDWVRGKSRS